MISIPSPNPPRVARPLFLSRVPAGFPSPAEDYVECSLDLNEYLIAHREATFFVRVKGHSMTGAGIRDGDIVVAVVDGELTVKRLSRRGGTVRLLPEYPGCAPIEFKDGQELTVWGVVTSVIHRVK